MDNENIKKWMNFLDPGNFKDNLIFSSIFIAFFESLKDYVVEEVKFFYNTGFDKDEFTFSSEYKSKVLSKDKSPVLASFLWLVEGGAISEDDIKLYDKIRERRNTLSHELMEMLFEGMPDDLPDLLVDMVTLRVKIEKWWVINVDIPTGAIDNSGIEINEENIVTQSEVIFKIIFDMLTGDEKEAAFYLNEFKKAFKK